MVNRSLRPVLDGMKKVKTYTKVAGSSYMVDAYVIGSSDSFEFTGKPCHGFLQHSLKANLKSTPLFVLTKIKDQGVDENIVRRFYEWLLNQSPYRHTFISKNPRKILENGVIVSNCETNNRLFAGGLIASRLPWENYSNSHLFKQLELWDRLIQNGVDPNVSYIISQWLRRLGGQHGFKKVSVQTSGLGHSPISTDPNTFWNFLNEEYSDKAPTNYYYDHNKQPNANGLYSELVTYNIPSSLWTKPTKSMDMHEAIRSKLQGMGAKEVPPTNPFKAAIVKKEAGASVYDYDEAIEELSPFLRSTRENNVVQAA